MPVVPFLPNMRAKQLLRLLLARLEAKSVGTISQCLLAYPTIANHVKNPYAIDVDFSSHLQKLREHVVELARAQAVEEAEIAQRQEAIGHTELAQRSKGNVARLLSRLKPGRNSCIDAVLCDDGTVVTAPEDMAKTLRSHWSSVFERRGVEENKLKEWVADDIEERTHLGELQTLLANLKLARDHIKTALDRSNNSSPGPDGVPYLAWRRLASEAIEVLFEAAEYMFDPANADTFQSIYEDFNASLLMYLPKKRPPPLMVQKLTDPRMFAR